MIRTERLRLVPCDEALLRAIVAGPEETARQLLAVVPPGWPQFPEAYSFALERLAAGDDLRPWWTYVFLDDKRGALIGSGGFAGRPSSDGIVEVGYETAPAFRGRGYATEAAGGLVTFAFGSAGISAVDAQTLAATNASVRVLERNGFKRLGAVEHPDEGTVWHWRVTRAEWETKAG